MRFRLWLRPRLRPGQNRLFKATPVASYYESFLFDLDEAVLLLLMDKNCLAVQDCQARPQAFESAHILLFSINHQDSS